MGQWYCYHYNMVHGPIMSERVADVLQRMTDTMKLCSRKPITLNVYSQQHYQDHIKPLFDAKWCKVKHVIPSSACLVMIKDFIHKSWNNETMEFKKAFQKEINDAYTMAVDK